MKIIGPILFLVVLYLSVYPAEVPVGSPVTGPLFVMARDLYGRGFLDVLEYSSIGEPSLEDANGLIMRIGRRLEQIRGEYMNLESTPGISARIEIVESNRQDTHNTNYLKFFPRIKIGLSEKLSANLLYRIDGELDNDSRYDGKSWNGIAGFPENATIDYQDDSFGLRFGIERVSWGAGSRSNLMFASQAMPMTLLGFSYRRWILDFESIIGFLGPLKDQLDGMVNDTSFFTSQQRYLSAHSLTLRPVEGLSLSFRETMLYGGPGRRLEPAYAIPFIWYHGEQLNSRMDDNVILGLAADYRAMGRIWTYGEILIDDFQIEKKTRGDYEPDQLGFLCGAELYDLPLDGIGYGIEYARVNNWTFNQARAHNRYINSNFPIGFADGPDSDVLGWRISMWFTGDVKIMYQGYYRRRGEGRIDTPWSRPWLLAESYNEPFPSGNVERVMVNGLDLLVFNKNWLWGNVAINFTDISNVDNFSGKNHSSWAIATDIAMKLPPFSWEF